MDVIARLRDQLDDITKVVTVLHRKGEDILALTHFKLRKTFTVSLTVILITMLLAMLEAWL